MNTWKPEILQVGEHTYTYISEGTLARNNPALVSGSDFSIALDATAHVNDMAEFISAMNAVTGRRQIKYLFFTHSHGDHTDGAVVLSGAAQIAAEGLIRILKETKQRKEKDIVPLTFTEKKGERVPIPEIGFTGHMMIDPGDCRVELIDFGHAHTPSDAIAYIPEDGVVFCGDLLYNKVLPDGNQCRLDRWIDAIDSILMLDAETYIPGPGPVAKREDVMVCRSCLEQMYVSACEAADKGRDLKELCLQIDLGECEEWLEPGRRVSLLDVAYRTHLGQDPVMDLPDWDINETIDEIRISRGLKKAAIYIPTKEYPYFRYMDPAFRH